MEGSWIAGCLACWSTAEQVLTAAAAKRAYKESPAGLQPQDWCVWVQKMASAKDRARSLSNLQGETEGEQTWSG